MDMNVSELSVAELESRITTCAGRLVAGEAQLIELLGEFDERGGWVGPGLLSCAHWASWRLGLSLSTAREKLRVAKALRGLPQTRERFAAGALSYAQVRAVTRIACAADEQMWLRLAQNSTASQLDRAVRGVRRAQRCEAEQADPLAAAEDGRDEVRVSWTEDGDLLVSTRIRARRAPAVMAALDAARAEVQAERDAQLAEVVAAVCAQDPPAGGSEPAGQARPAGGPEPEGCGQDPPAGGFVPGPAQLATEAARQAYAAVVAAFPDGVPSSYVFAEPDYPIDIHRPEATPRAERDRLLAAWREELERRRRQRDAWRAWQEQLSIAALSAHVPVGRATLADGLVRVLTHRDDGTSRVRLQLLVDPLSGWARTTSDELFPPALVSQIRDDSENRPELPRVRPLTAADLTRLDQHRDSRVVSPRQRQLLGQLDGERCRMPGCTRVRKLHAHHVRFWREGGPTDLANLVLLCSRHHTVVHAEGFELRLGPDRSLTVRTRDGVEVPHLPELPAAVGPELDANPGPAPALTSEWRGEQMDLGHVVWVLLQHAA